jgi:CRISPR-associated endoribonuclease Cas6
VDESVSARIHDAPLGNLHNSGLRGVFGHSDRDHHKSVRPDQTYTLSLGVVDSEDEDVFQALVQAFVLDGDTIELTDGTLQVETFESHQTSHDDLRRGANELDNPTLTLSFETPTCIEEAGAVTTMFPHRASVFRSLVGKWNQTVEDEYAFDLDRETIEANVIEKPDATSYDTHSVLVNRVSDSNANPRPIFRQGFTGECSYAFKNASESVENAVTTLALFAEYAGVGSAVARGCGHVEVET